MRRGHGSGQCPSQCLSLLPYVLWRLVSMRSGLLPPRVGGTSISALLRASTDTADLLKLLAGGWLSAWSPFTSMMQRSLTELTVGVLCSQVSASFRPSWVPRLQQRSNSSCGRVPLFSALIMTCRRCPLMRVTFWARDRIQKKLLDIITQARSERRLPAGTGSKLYGIANFFEIGVWGRVGCGGLAAIKAWQQERTGELTPAILHSFEVLEAIISLKPCRHLYVRPLPHPRFIAASDAALEEPGNGSGGFLLVWFSDRGQQREAFVADIPPQVYALWEPGDRKIAQLESLMVLYGLWTRPHAFRHRRGTWFIDNTAALMALIRGRSRNADLEHLATLIHMTLFALDAWFWFEWIPSMSNWADSISRLGASDPWCGDHNFTLHHAYCPFLIWHLPFPALIRVAQFLWVLWDFWSAVGEKWRWVQTERRSGSVHWPCWRVSSWDIPKQYPTGGRLEGSAVRWEKELLRKMSIGKMKRVLQCDVFLHSVWQAWVCKYDHLGNRVMFMTFWLKVEPNWLKHSVLPPPLP